MADTGANIRDIRSLEQLNNMIEYAGEAMANIEENVSNYLNGVKDVLDKQLEIIRKKLEEAEKRLSAAEKALRQCEASQKYDEEAGEYRPSCSCERSEVEAAQREVDEWRRKYEEGERIVHECQNEIDDYNFPGSPLSPPGGHYLIVGMRESQTPKASQQLRDCIDKLRGILETDVGQGEGLHVEDYVPEEQDKPLSGSDRLEAFKKNIQGIKDQQSSHSVNDANRAMRCPTCGRPLSLCICRNLHADVNLYQ